MEELIEGLREALAGRELEGLGKVFCKVACTKGHVRHWMLFVSDLGDFLG